MLPSPLQHPRTHLGCEGLHPDGLGNRAPSKMVLLVEFAHRLLYEATCVASTCVASELLHLQGLDPRRDLAPHKHLLKPASVGCHVPPQVVPLVGDPLLRELELDEDDAGLTLGANMILSERGPGDLKAGCLRLGHRLSGEGIGDAGSG